MNSEYRLSMSRSVKSSMYLSASSFRCSTSRVPDQVGRVTPLAERLGELLGAALRDAAEVALQLRARHADAVVLDGERARLLVARQPDAPGVRLRALLRQRQEPLLVARVRGVRDELAQEDVLVGVERVDDDVHDLRDLRLELVRLGARLVRRRLRRRLRHREDVAGAARGARDAGLGDARAEGAAGH